MTGRNVFNLVMGLIILFGIIWFISKAWKAGQAGSGNVVNIIVGALMIFGLIWLISKAWRLGQS